MPTSITYAMADGVNRNDVGVGGRLLAMLARGTPAWHRDAACHEHPELSWFPERGEDLGPARAVCASCLVLGECRSWALE